MPSLTAGLGLREALQDTVTTGAAFVPRSLDETFRVRLLAEVEQGPFRAMPEHVDSSGVRQQTDGYAIRGNLGDYPLVHELRERLTACVRLHADVAGELGTWLPNDAFVQRYRPHTLGISPHLDGKRYRCLVAVFTLDGEASFALCADRSGTVTRQWQASPGDLLLMRGPGLAGNDDGRPLHMVGGPRDRPRTSLSLRMSAGGS